ncbi:MAG: hypothetical protein IT393_12235 [Nitrospirae bacterium]|nr:hypothetical protein [Nitrospirota bacterium]
MASQIRLTQLSLSWKVLITGFIIIVSAGYLNGALNAALSTGITPSMVAEHYGGQVLSASETKELKEKGFVENEVNLDGDDEGNQKHHDETAGQTTSVKPISLQQMAQLAHIHLLGFSFILISVGALACFTALAEWIKALVVGILGFAFLFDIGGLYMVRFVSANLAWLPVITGVTIGVCLAFISLRVLYEMWLT